MNKPKWSDKWRSLSDSRRARNAAAGTTSETTTTGLRGASVVTTTKNPPQKSLYPNPRLVSRDFADMEWVYVQEMIDIYRTYYRQRESTDSSNARGSQYPNSFEQTRAAQDQIRSALSTQQQTEPLPAYRSVTTEVKGKVRPSTSIEEALNTPSPSTTDTQTTGDW